MTEKKLYRRVVRRSLHRSRSLTVIVALALAIVALAYVATEAVLAALGLPALLVLEVPVWAAAIAVVIGLVFVLLAITPGRRARHELADDRMAVVVDDAVLAGALKNVALREARVPSTRVAATVGRRTGDVRITPTSGVAVDREAVASATQRVIDALVPRPGMRSRVTVAEQGVVGS